MAILTVDLKFSEGDIVYLATDPDQQPRMVVAILIEGGRITYRLSMGQVTSWHGEMEIAAEKNVLINSAY